LSFFFGNVSISYLTVVLNFSTLNMCLIRFLDLITNETNVHYFELIVAEWNQALSSVSNAASTIKFYTKRATVFRVLTNCNIRRITITANWLTINTTYNQVLIKPIIHYHINKLKHFQLPNLLHQLHSHPNEFTHVVAKLFALKEIKNSHVLI